MYQPTGFLINILAELNVLEKQIHQLLFFYICMNNWEYICRLVVSTEFEVYEAQRLFLTNKTL